MSGSTNKLGTVIDHTPTKAIYSQMAKYYNLLHHLQTLWADTRHRRLVAEVAALDASKACLEIGCGSGLGSVELCKAYPHLRVVALDYSANMLSVARETLRREKIGDLRVDLIQGDATNMPFKADSFDAVTSVYGLGGIRNVEKAMAEIVRVARVGATFCFGEMTRPPVHRKAIEKWIHRTVVEPWIYRFWGFRDIDLTTACSNAGIKSEVINYYNDRMLGSMSLLKGRRT